MSAFVLRTAWSTTPTRPTRAASTAIWGMYQWLDRAPLGRNEHGLWWRRHDEYGVIAMSRRAIPQLFRSHHAHRPLVPRLVGVSALFFVAATATTAAWCASMPAMDMPMPGGWTMSMTWMRMPGQTWPGAAAAFLAMWSVMMVAMMLPALAAGAAALRRGRGRDRRRTRRPAGRGRRRRLLRRLGRRRPGHLPDRHLGGGPRHDAAVAVSPGAVRDRRGAADRRRRAVHRLQGAGAGVLRRAAWRRPAARPHRAPGDGRRTAAGRPVRSAAAAT